MHKNAKFLGIDMLLGVNINIETVPRKLQLACFQILIRVFRNTTDKKTNLKWFTIHIYILQNIEL